MDTGYEDDFHPIETPHMPDGLQGDIQTDINSGLLPSHLYKVYTRRRQSTNASRLRIKACSVTPTKWFELDEDDLPYRPLTITPSLMMAKDFRYSQKPFKMQKQKV